MELKDFISQSIEQISLGLIEASDKCKDYGVIVNPDIIAGSNGDYWIPKNPERVFMTRRVQLLDMDISVAVNEGEISKVSGKAGISFLGVAGDYNAEKTNANENRIKFSIPICFPNTTVLKKDQ